MSAARTVCAALMAGSSGCAMLNGFLDPTSVGPNALLSNEGTLDIRDSLSLQDTPTGGMTASDPLPEDLVPVVEEYKFAIGDVLTARVFQLLGRNTETAVQATIDETGHITIPAVGELQVQGLTRREIEAELIDAIVRKGIVLDPEVVVEPVVRRGLTYTVYGTISQPNLYPLAQYNLRLLQAINLAGGFLDSVMEIMVTRNQDSPEAVVAPAGVTSRSRAARPRHASLNISDGYGGSGAGGQPADPAPQRAAPDPNVAPPEGEDSGQAIIDTMLDESERTSTPDDPASEPPPIQPSPSQPRWIWYNDRWVETQPADAPRRPTQPLASIPEEAGPEAEPLPIAEPDSRPTIDWDQVAGERKQRIIKISADALRNGDPRQNIIVRPGDVIRLASGEFGEYYMTGQVTRPGAYSLTGRQLTLKAAIAAAGDFAPLAWPSNCTIFRRYGDREEMRQVNLDAIFAGREQDLFVKKDDLILIGTTPVAPFLAVLRNSFRASYGFGFVYDRNFADIDSYNPKINPDNLPGRFPNLFPENR